MSFLLSLLADQLTWDVNFPRRHKKFARHNEFTAFCRWGHMESTRKEEWQADLF
jgi:hypothetical protein